MPCIFGAVLSVHAPYPSGLIRYFDLFCHLAIIILHLLIALGCYHCLSQRLFHLGDLRLENDFKQPRVLPQTISMAWRRGM
jgi:hypothetical protein